MSILIASAAISTALVAGIFFAFSTFVMQALARLQPKEGMAAMQSINITVLNPWFFGAFFGAGILSLATTITAFIKDTEANQTALVIGAVLYLFGCIAVTIVGNVPLNDKLADMKADEPGADQLWNDYLVRWTRWNHVRTVGSLAAAVVFMLAW